MVGVVEDVERERFRVGVGLKDFAVDVEGVEGHVPDTRERIIRLPSYRSTESSRSTTYLSVLR